MVKLSRVLGPCVAVGILAATAMAGSASAQSFDCRRANQPHELTICSEPKLAAADLRLNEAFQTALAASPEPDALRTEQRDWNQNLRACGEDPRCLYDTYADRISTLERDAARQTDHTYAAPMGPIEAPPSEEIVASDPDLAESGGVDPTLEPSGGISDRTTPEAATASTPNTASTSAGLSLEPAWLVAIGVGLFVLIGLSVHVLNISANRYGYDMLFNKMAILHVVVVACAWLTLMVPYLFGPIAVLTFLVILFNNIRRTDLLIGTVGSLIQPVALLLTFMGARWLATAMRPKH